MFHAPTSPDSFSPSALPSALPFFDLAEVTTGNLLLAHRHTALAPLTACPCLSLRLSTVTLTLVAWLPSTGPEASNAKCKNVCSAQSYNVTVDSWPPFALVSSAPNLFHTFVTGHGHKSTTSPPGAIRLCTSWGTFLSGTLMPTYSFGSMLVDCFHSFACLRLLFSTLVSCHLPGGK